MVIDREKVFERAARLYCQATGLKADDPMKLPHPSIAGVMIETPVWKMVAERLQDLALMLNAIRVAKEEAVKEDAANESRA